MSIAQLLNTRRHKTPDLTALVDNEQSLTFAEIGERIDTLAETIQRHHLFKRGEIIPVCMDRGNNLVIAVLAVLKAGGVYLAIPLELPKERVRYMLNDTAAKLVLSDEPSMERTLELLNDSAEVLSVNMELFETSVAFEEVVINNEDPAYIIYTSGTTGVPKGVIISHGAVLNLIQAMEICLYERNEGPIREALTTPIVFDASVQQILSCVTNGNTLFIPTEKQRTDPFLLLEFLNKHEIELFNVVASYLDAMVASGISVRFPSSLRQIVTGGEVVNPELISSFFGPDHLRNVRITNMYGPTENCVDSSYFHIEYDTQISTQIPIGTEVPGTVITIRDESGRTLPDGETGEICVAGKGLATGYLNLPELTDAKFVVIDGQRTYKTGDLGFRNKNGLLEFSGRMDDQLKINGYRIEPQEITNTLLTLQSVSQACVFAAGTESRKELVAFVVLVENQTAKQIKTELSKKIPVHMIPGRIIPVDRFPLTINGKTDKKRLLESLETAENDSMQGDHAIQQVLQLAADVCGRLINADLSFREQGIDSIHGIRLLGRIRNTFGVELYVQEFMECGNLRNVTVLLESKGKNNEHVTNSYIEPSEKQTYTLSRSQKRLWHIYQQTNLSTSYNVPVVFHLHDISGDILEQSLRILLERHPMLRTAFREQQETIVQEVLPMNRLSFSLERFIANNTTMQELISEVSNRENMFRFKLYEPPHIRATLVDSVEKQAVVLNFPHLVVDGWSLTILYKELNEIYRSLQEKKSLELPSPEHSYIDYTIWHDGLDLSEHTAFWTTYLHKFPGGLKLPQDAFNHENFEAGTVFLEVGRTVFEQIQTICSVQQLTPAMVFLSAYKLFLYKLTGQDDLCIGMGVLGRTRTEWDNLCGFFMNMLPVRTQITGEDSPSDLLRKTKQSVNDILRFQDFPVEELARIVSGKELFNVIFAYQNFNEVKKQQDVAQNHFSVNSLELKPAHQAKFDLSLQIYEQENNYTLEFEYRKKMFHKETMRNWLNALASAVPVLCDSMLSEEKSL